MSVLSQLKLLWSKDETRVYLSFITVCIAFAISLFSVVTVKYYQQLGADRASIFSDRCYKKGGFPISLDKYVDGYGDRVCVESLRLINIPDEP